MESITFPFNSLITPGKIAQIKSWVHWTTEYSVNTLITKKYIPTEADNPGVLLSMTQNLVKFGTLEVKICDS